jgi:hypothetical protein
MDRGVTLRFILLPSWRFSSEELAYSLPTALAENPQLRIVAQRILELLLTRFGLAPVLGQTFLPNWYSFKSEVRATDRPASSPSDTRAKIQWEQSVIETLILVHWVSYCHKHV